MEDQKKKEMKLLSLKYTSEMKIHWGGVISRLDSEE